MAITQIFLIILNGLAMGVVDLIPGISGGTLALITGIYGRLVTAIKCFDIKAFKLVLSGKILDFIRYVDGVFLLCLGIGIIISIFSFARAVDYMLDNQPLLLFSFFTGVIVASSIVLIRKIGNWPFSNYISIFFGVIVALLLSGLNEYTTPNTSVYVFMAGIIGGGAMLLPGISGSFILLLVGKYSYMINAVKEFDVFVLCVFGLGYFVGVLSFAKLLSWVLKRHFQISLLFLIGLMLGSFNKIWPWRIVENDDSSIGNDLYSRSVLPWEYENLSNSDPQIIISITIIISGFVLVILMHRIGSKFIRIKS